MDILKLFITSIGFATAILPQGVEHARELARQPDGSYQVVCIDDQTETRSAVEVQRGEVCTHIHHTSGVWTLDSGGVENGTRMCDLHLELTVTPMRVLDLSARFEAPCEPQEGIAHSCDGYNCSIKMGNSYYTFDFSTRRHVTVTRLSDGFNGVFVGDSANLGEPLGVQEILAMQTVNGVANILQASNDGGVTWLSVCDDEFGQKEAEVACRQMGFSGVDQFSTAISVSGDSEFGLDDVKCNGSEKSLFDCGHTEWAEENCGAGEHVRLTCVP